MATNLDPEKYPDVEAGYVRVSHTVAGELRHFTAHVSLLDADPGLRPLQEKALDQYGRALPPKYQSDFERERQLSRAERRAAKEAAVAAGATATEGAAPAASTTAADTTGATGTTGAETTTTGTTGTGDTMAPATRTRRARTSRSTGTTGTSTTEETR